MTTGLRKSPEPVFAACYCHRTGGTRILRRAATLGSSSMTEQLTFIVYASRAVEPFDHDDLVDLLSQSRENNSRDGITGMLVYRDLDFIQILEGPDAAVRALLERIGRDPRHTDVRVLLEEQTTERKYAAWSMGYEPTVPGDGSDGAVDALQAADGDESTRESADALGGWFHGRAGGSTD